MLVAAKGFVISLEVCNALAFAQAMAPALNDMMELTHVEWGQSHCTVLDPAGFQEGMLQYQDAP